MRRARGALPQSQPEILRMKPGASNLLLANTPTREELALYMPLAHQVVGRVLRKLPPNVLRDDLVAAGAFGLIDALRTRVDRAPAFAWYARTPRPGASPPDPRPPSCLTPS